MPPISRLRVANFRGASTPFEIGFANAKDKPLVVIFGENGTGKSTIVDALDAVGNASGGSLTFRSSTTLQKHLPTLGKHPKDITIEVAIGDTTYTAALTRTGLVIHPRPRPPIRVLRRVNLQRFIDSRPGDRYNEVKHLIGVENVERSEDALRRAVENANRDLDEAVRDRSNAEAQLDAIWQEGGAPGTDWLSWARGMSATDVTALKAQVDRSRTTRHAVQTALGTHADWEAARGVLAERRRAAASVEREVRAEPALDAAKAVGLVETLERMTRYLAAGGDGDQCPVCATGVPLADLQASVADRLAGLNRFQILADRQRAATQATRDAKILADNATRKMVAAAERVWEFAVDPPAGFAPLPVPAEARDAFAVREPGADDELERVAAFIVASANLGDTLQTEEDAALAEATRITTVRPLLASVERSTDDARQLERIVKGLAAAHEVAHTGRIAFTQSILDEVAADCNRLFEAIHPGEAIASAKILLDLKKRASINQTVGFGGQADLPPQAYFSEAHLDTFGFCFWLAFAKRECPDRDAVLVLDDVFSSVDAAHLSRITDVIVAERDKFAQIIITTHQRGWRDAFTNSYGPGNLTTLVELRRWSLAAGMYSEQTPMALDALRRELAKPTLDRQTAASQAGILLEATLDRLTYRYACRVRRKRSNAYTLDELLSATSDLFKKLEVAHPPAFEPVKLGALANQLKPLLYVRNQVGAHYNPDGATVADAEVREFATFAARLVESVTCQTCGQIPNKEEVTHLRCTCKKDIATRMTPVKIG